MNMNKYGFYCNKIQFHFRKDKEATLVLTHTHFSSLSRPERVCENSHDYDWGTCLDHLFYLRKGKVLSLKLFADITSHF